MSFNPARICGDPAIWLTPGHPAPSPPALQALFERHGSGLASMRVEGQTAAVFIWNVSHNRYINALSVVARLQTEQSLVSTAHPSAHALQWACGFGATDGGRMEEYAGFAAQIRGHCDFFHDKRAAFQAKVDAKAVFHTTDGHTVTPVNVASYGLLVYTPWGGDKDSHGNKSPFGCYLFQIALRKYAAEMGLPEP